MRRGFRDAIVMKLKRVETEDVSRVATAVLKAAKAMEDAAMSQ